jgi:hypothetical protein
MESSDCLAQGTFLFLLSELICSCLYHGGTSAYGLCWMEWTRQKTRSDVCSTTTLQWDFGDHGIGAIIYGSSGKSECHGLG